MVRRWKPCCTMRAMKKRSPPRSRNARCRTATSRLSLRSACCIFWRNRGCRSYCCNAGVRCRSLLTEKDAGVQQGCRGLHHACETTQACKPVCAPHGHRDAPYIPGFDRPTLNATGSSSRTPVRSALPAARNARSGHQ